jgi:hypothetical protein
MILNFLFFYQVVLLLSWKIWLKKISLETLEIIYKYIDIKAKEMMKVVVAYELKENGSLNIK